MSTTTEPKLIAVALLEAILRGYVEVIATEEGEPRYRITESGVKHMDDVLEGKEGDK